jgi:DTW domain-containing protein YfiP
MTEFKNLIDEIAAYTVDQWTQEKSNTLRQKIIDSGYGVEKGELVVMLPASWDEAQQLIRVLGNLVGLNALVHIHSDLVKSAVAGPVRKRWLKPFTAHNDKMGYNWNGKEYEKKK